MVRRYKICLLAGMLLGILGGCQKEEYQVPELKEPVEVKVDTAVAQVGDIYEIDSYSAQIVPYVEEAWFLEDGTLKELHVMIGDMVEEGQLLATLDDEDLQEEIERLEEQLAYTKKMGEYSDQQMNLSIEIAEHEAERIRTGWGNFQQLQLKENEVLGLKTELKQAQELRNLDIANQSRLIEELKANLGQMELKAPMAGKVVYIKNVQQGSSIKGYEPLICIADDNRLSVMSEYISESQIENADEIYAQVQDQIYEVSYVPYDREEYITMVLSGEDMSTQFDIKNPKGGLESGQFAAVVLKYAAKEDVLLIPANALHSDSNGRYVYRMEGDKRIRQDVTTGALTALEVEIKEGLQEGDVVYVKE